jgi:hypothetical protein
MVWQNTLFAGGRQGGQNEQIAVPGGWVTPVQGGGGGGLFGGLVNAFSDLGSSISNAVESVGKTVESAAQKVGATLEAIAQNPLPAIETIALIILAPELAATYGVTQSVVMAVGSTAISVANGEKDPEKIAIAAAAAYAGAKTSEYVSGQLTSTGPTQGSYIPSATNSFLVKTASSAAGSDVAATTAALARGDNFGDALTKGTQAAVTSLAGSVGGAAGSEVASNVEDPTLAKIAGSATKGATTAALTGKDIGAGASKSAQGDILDAAGNVISQYAPDISGSTGFDLSGAKQFFKPISDVATQVFQPFEQPIKDVAQAGSDIATQVFQPFEQPIKDVAQAGSDIATKVLQPLEKPIKDFAQIASDAATKVLKPVGKAAGDFYSSLPDVSVPKLDRDVMSAIADQYRTATPSADATTGGTTIGGAASPDISTATTGTSGSPAAYAGADIAMLGDTAGTLGSKGVKKGGKYPWGDPEGTTALKEGLGV